MSVKINSQTENDCIDLENLEAGALKNVTENYKSQTDDLCDLTNIEMEENTNQAATQIQDINILTEEIDDSLSSKQEYEVKQNKVRPALTEASGDETQIKTQQGEKAQSKTSTHNKMLIEIKNTLDEEMGSKTKTDSNNQTLLKDTTIVNTRPQCVDLELDVSIKKDKCGDEVPMKSSASPKQTSKVEMNEISAKQKHDLTEKQEDNYKDIPDSNSDDVEAIESNVMVIEIDDDDDEDERVENATAPVKQLLAADASTSLNVQEIVESVKSITTKQSTEVELMEHDQIVTRGLNDTEIEKIKQSPVEALTKLNDDVENSLDDGHNLLKETQPRETNSCLSNDDDDTSGEVFYNKECINYECHRQHKQYFRAPLFALSYFKIAKKKFKAQYICSTCYDQALDMYEEFSSLLAAKQPMLLKDVVGGRPEFVEIIDSSDEEDENQKAEKLKDNNCFSKEDIELIEKELDNSIRRVLDRVEIQNQLTWSKTILLGRLKALDEENNYIEEELRSLQKKADNMHVALYQCPKIKVRQLQPFDLNTGRPYTTVDPEIALPPLGEIQRPAIQIGETYYAAKNKAIASWVACKIMEPAETTVVAQKNIKSYKIKFLKSHYQMVKTVSVKHLAYFEAPSVRLPIGSRVIAYFDASSLSRGKEKMMIQSAFYPGIIAEPLKPNNKYRYLIFYDDGYTQYVSHKDVRLVCNVSENVWEDVHPGSRDFIQKYLTQYSINRPMVQTQKGQSMTTESNGKWIYARVVDIDCSLIQMQFEGPKSHTEWIYRGSMRLGPVFKEHQKSMQKTQMPVSRLPRRTEPFIRYTEDEEATTTQQQQRQEQQQQQSEPRAVAKKSVSRQESTSSSTSQPVPTVRHLNNSTIYLEDENKPKGKVVYYTAKRNLPPLSYSPHTCAPSCLFKITHNLSAYSPLSKPLLSGWERMIIRQKAKKVVTYRGPCGKILRNMKELRNYLRATENVLNVENFDFNHETNCLAEYVIDSAIVQVRDISCGQEKMAIPLVNYYDNTMPPECKYAAQRIPTEGVNLNLDEEFLAGCDCEDDCSDKTKCSCWQLTYAGAKYGNPNTPMEEIGYQYKRLYEHVPTGIYECNSRCKCKSNCLNRVVQHSLEMKLQVFKTSNRGWGLRCINDIPRGSFICVYAGHLLTEDRANEGGLDVGDEYFAELDYIEVAEQIKEGYESEVESAEHEEDDEFIEHEDDDEFTPSKPLSTRSKSRSQRSTRGNQSQNNEDESQERQMINFNPNAVMDENSMRESSIRKLYGKDESCYVMDAKITGNLGRYFNHSCLPNLFVQNVFVDTHDLRFPWVAFFASTHIRAGTELTWNYNYEVGVVPGKVLYCQCGAPNCRLRLL